MKEQIPGGLASGRSPKDFPAAALRKGTAVELEHVVRPGKKTTAADRATAREIAMDHLAEDPRYYTYLEKMETKMAKMETKMAKSKRRRNAAGGSDPKLTDKQRKTLALLYAHRLWGSNPDLPNPSRWKAMWGGPWKGQHGSVRQLAKKTYGGRPIVELKETGTGAGWGAQETSYLLTDAGVELARKMLGRKVLVAKTNAKPKSKVRIKAKREGKLGGPGYLSKSDAARRKLLRACVKKWGYRSCMGSIVALEVWGKRSLTVAQKRKLLRDRTYLRKTFGAAARNQPATPPSKARAMGALKYLNDAAARMRS